MHCQGVKILRAVSLISFIVVCIDARAQTLALPPWTVLGEASTAVVVGEVLEGQLEVVNPEKKAKAEVTPDGKPTFPNPMAYMVGILSRVQVSEVIKTDGKIKKGDAVAVFIYGFYASDMPHVLTKKERCVLFLRPLDASNKTLLDAVIERPGPPGSVIKRERFDPSGCYTPVREGYAQVILSPGKTKIIDEIK